MFFSFYTARSQSVIINEWGQGVPLAGPLCSSLTEATEWIELLVVGPGPVNLGGWRLRDSPGGAVLLEFKNDPFWNNIPPGTIIVVYNIDALFSCQSNEFGNGANQVPDDLSKTDCNYKIVVGSNNSTLFEPSFNWGSNSYFDNSTTVVTYNPVLFNNGGTIVHDWDQGNNASFTGATVRPNTNAHSVHYTGNSAAGISNASNWTKETNPSNATPGEPNGGANTTWINSLRAIPNAPSAPAVTRCGPGDVTFTASMGSQAGTEIRLYDQQIVTLSDPPIASANSAPYLLTVPNVTQTTTFYIRSAAPSAGCLSPHTAVVANIVSLPNPPLAPDTVYRCGPGPMSFTVSAQGGSSQILLYDVLTGGTPVATITGSSGTFSFPNVTTTTTYFSETIGAAPTNCVSASRKYTVLKVNPIPAPPTFTLPAAPFGINPDTIARCGPGSATITATPGTSGNIVRLFSSPPGPAPIAVTPVGGPHELVTPSVNTTTTFMLQTFNVVTGCSSATNTPITIKINPNPPTPNAPDVQACGNASSPATITFTATVAPPTGLELRLYTSSVVSVTTDVGTSVTSQIAPTTNPISVTTTFYLGYYNTNTQCSSATRKAVVATINPIPGNPSGIPVTACQGQSITVQANPGSPFPAGSSIRFYTVSSGGTPLSTASAPPYTFTPNPSPNTTTTYYLEVVTPSGCTSDNNNRPSVTVTINPNPTPTWLPDTVIQCVASVNSVSFTVNTPGPGEAIRLFTMPSGGTAIATTPTPLSTTVTTTTTFYLDVINTTTQCSSVGRHGVVARILSLPQPPVMSNQSRCGDGSFTITANVTAVPNLSVLFYNVPVGGVPIATITNSPYTFTTPTLTVGSSPNIVTYYAATVINNPAPSPSCTSSTRSQVVLTINPNPSAPIAPPNPISRCGSGPVTISPISMGTIPGNLVLLYTVASNPPAPAPPIPSIASGISSINLSNVATSSTLYAEVVNTTTGCTSQLRTAIPVTINPNPNPPQTTTAQRCGAGAVDFTITLGASPSGNQLQIYTVTTTATPIATVSGTTWTSPAISTTTTYFVESVETSTNCTSTSRTPIIAQINPVPGKPGAANISRCASSIAPLTFTASSGVPPSSEIRLYDVPSGGTPLATATGAFLLTPSVLPSTTTTYYLEGVAGGCVGERAEVVLTVFPNPGAPVASPVSVCGEQAATIVAQMGAPPGSQMRLYSVSSGGNPIATDNSVPYELVTPAVNVTTTFYLEAFNFSNGCASNRTAVVVTVNSPPNLPSVSTNSILARCGNGPITFTADVNGTNPGNRVRLYSAPAGGNFITEVSSPYQITVPNVTTSTIYYISSFNTATNCESPRAQVKLTIFPLPPAPTLVESTKEICAGNAVTFFANVGTLQQAEVLVYNTATGGVPIATDNISPYDFTPTPSPNTTTTYFFELVDKSTSISCTSASRSQGVVVVNPVPGSPTAANVQRCGAGSVTFTAFMGTPPGQVIKLYASQAATTEISSDNTGPDYWLGTGNIQATTTFWLEVTSEKNCVSPRTSVVATINPLPAPPTSNGAVRCGPGTVTFTVAFGSPGGDRIELYTLPSGGVPLGPAAEFNNPPFFLQPGNVTTTTTFYPRTINTATQCTSVSGQVIVTIHPIPGTPVASDVSRCGDGVVTFLPSPGFPSAPVLRLFETSNSNTPIAVDNSSPYQLETPTAITSTTTYWIDAFNPSTGCSSSTRRQVVATHNPIPPPATNLIGNIEAQRCGAGVVTFTGIILQGTPPDPQNIVLRLYATASGGQIIASTPAPQPYSITTNQINSTTTFFLETFNQVTQCVNTNRVQARAVILQEPGVPNAVNVSRCDAGIVTFTASMGSPAGTEIRLYTQLGAATPVATGTSPNFTLTLNSVATTTTYFIESFNTSTGCASQWNQVVATIHPSPAAPNAQDVQRCGNGRVTFFASMGTPQGNKIRMFSGNCNGTLVDSTVSAPYRLSANVSDPTTNFFLQVVNTATGCTSQCLQVTATVNPIPGTPFAPPVARCGSGTVTFVASMGTPQGKVLRLYTTPSGGTPIAEGNTNPSNLTTPSIGFPTTFYIEAVDDNNCVSERFPAVAQVNLNPAPPSAPNQSRCGSAVMTITATMGLPAGQSILLYDSNNNLIGSPATSEPYLLSTVTPVLITSTYFIEAVNNVTGCTSATRTPVILTIFPVPGTPLVENVERCGPGTIRFSPVMQTPAGTQMRLYSQPSGGPILVTDNTAPYQLTIDVETTSNFYVEAVHTGTGCRSDRALAQAIINEVPAEPNIPEAERCGPGVVSFSNLSINANTQFLMYTQASGGTAIDTADAVNNILSTPSINTTTTFFVEAVTSAGCKSKRIPLRAIIRPSPAPPIVNVESVARCGPGVVTLSAQLTGVPAGDIMYVYDISTGGIPIATINQPPYTYTTENLSQSQTYYFESYSSSTGCRSATRTGVAAIINDIPSEPNILQPNLTRCNSGPVVFTATMGTIPGTEFRMYTSQTGGVPLVTGTSQLATPAIAVSNVPVTVSYYIESVKTNTSPVCRSNRVLVTATVYPSPGLPRVLGTDATVSRCGPGEVTFTVMMGSPAGDVIRVYSTAVPGSTPIATDNTSPYWLTVNVSTTTIFYFDVFNTQTGCASPLSVSGVANVNLSPGAPIVAEVSRCGLGQVTFTAVPTAPHTANAMYLYPQEVGGVPLAGDNTAPYELTSPQLVNTITAFWVEAQNTVTGCASTRTLVSAVVKPIPADINLGQDGPKCVGETLTLTANNGQNGVVYSWVGPNNFAAQTQDTRVTIANVTMANRGQYSVTATLGDCPSKVFTIDVTINPTPPLPLAQNNGPICAGDNLTLTASGVLGAVYRWRGPLGFDVQGPGPEFRRNGVTQNMGGTYSLQAIQNGCTSAVATTNVIINPIPTNVQLFNDSPKCIGDVLTFTATGAPGAFYRIVGPNGFIAQGSGPIFTRSNVQASAAGNYSVTATVAGCTSPPTTSLVVINPIPNPPLVGNDSPKCVGSTLNLTASGNYPPNTTFFWTGPNGFTATGSGPGFIRLGLTAADAGAYSAVAIVNGCTSAVASTFVRINPIPEMPEGGANSPICQGQTLILTTPGVPGVTYLWTAPDGFSVSGAGSTFSRPLIQDFEGGIYSLQAIVGNCTSAARTIAVVVNPGAPFPPTINVNPNQACSGQSLTLGTQLINGASYLWEGPNGFSSTLQNPIIHNITTANAGRYYLTVRVNGCTYPVAQTEVQIGRTPPRPSVGSNGPLCEGQTLNLSASTIPNVSYEWTSNSIAPFTSNLQNPSIPNARVENSGEYEVRAISNDGFGCQSEPAKVNVVIRAVPPRPVLSSSFVTACSGQSFNVDIVNTFDYPSGSSYTWTGPAGFFASANKLTRVNVQTTDAGNYTVYVRNGNCTSEVANVTVEVKQTPPPARISSNAPICEGNTLSLTGTFIPGVTYSWRVPPSNLVHPGNSGNPRTLDIPNATISAHQGVYTLVATNGACSSEATLNVVINPTPIIASVGSNQPICAGQQLELNAASLQTGVSFMWEGPNNFTAFSPNPIIYNATTLASGTYRVRARIGSCTSSVATVDVMVNPAPPQPPRARANTPVCAGSELQLTAEFIPGATYRWSGPNSFNSTLQNPVIPNVSVSNGGTYSVVAAFGNCASEPSTVRVTVDPAPTFVVATSNSPVCEGSPLQLSAPTYAGATYQWRGPGGYTSQEQNPIISSATSRNAGVYTLVVSIGNCVSAPVTVNVVVTQRPVIASVGSNSPVCANSELRLTATQIPNATYIWEGPQSNVVISPVHNPQLAAGTYMSGDYRVRAVVNGCTSAPMMTRVIVNPSPTPPIVSSNGPELCSGQNLLLSATEVSEASYIWTGPNNFTSTLQNPVRNNITVADQGVYSLNVIVNGCSLLTPITYEIVVRPVPNSPAILSNSPLCAGQDLSLQATPIAGATYQWQGPNGFSAQGSTVTRRGIRLVDAGIYYLITVVNGCTTPVASVNVVVNRTPVLTNGRDITLCAGQPLNLTTTFVPGASYSWSGPGFTSTEQNPTITNTTTLNSGTYSVTAVANGCTSAIATTRVTVNPTPQNVVAGSNSPLCEGATLQLTVSVPGATYSWSGPAGFTSVLQNPTITNVSSLNAGTYSVIVAFGECRASAVPVTVQITPIRGVLNATNNGPVCAGSTLNLAATPIPGATYQWVGPNGFSSTEQNPFIQNATTSASGTYSVTAFIGACVTPTATTNVIVARAPQNILAGNNGPICEGQTLNLTATFVEGASYTWFGPGGYTASQQNPSLFNASPLQSGTYTVIATLGSCTSQPAVTRAVINPRPITPTAGFRAPACFGSPLQLQASSIPGATYLWTGPNGFASTQQNPLRPNLTFQDSGVYSLTIEVAGCPSPTIYTRVSVRPQPSAPSVGTIPAGYCVGDTVKLLAIHPVRGTTFQWTGPNGFFANVANPSFVAAPNNAGTYEVRAINAEGCPSVAVPVNVVVHNPSVSFVSTNFSICRGTSSFLVLRATGNGPWAVRYLANLQPSVAIINTSPYILPIAPTETTVYTLVDVTDANGCKGDARGAITVTVNSTPDAEITGSPVVCAGKSAELTVKVKDISPTERWELIYQVGNNIQQPITGIGERTFTINTGPLQVSTTVQLIMVTNTDHSCTSDWSINDPKLSAFVRVNPLPQAVLNTVSQSICQGESLPLEFELSGKGPWQVAYRENGISRSLTLGDENAVSPATISLPWIPRQTATYQFDKVTDATGCSRDINEVLEVTVHPRPTITLIGNEASICEGENYRLSAIFTGKGPWTWAHYVNGTLVARVIGDANSPSPYTYDTLVQANSSLLFETYRVIDANNCSAQVRGANFLLNVKPRPTPPLVANSSPVCEGASLKLTATHPQKGIEFIWIGPNGFTTSDPNPTIRSVTASAAGDYSVATVVNGCTSVFASTKVIVGKAPTAVLSGGTINNCGNSPVNLTVTLEGVPPFSYAYSVNNSTPIIVNGVAASPHILEVVPPGVGTWNYNLLWVTDATGCRGGSTSGIATVVVTGDLRLEVIRLGGIGCNGGNAIVTLRASGGTGNYRYSLNGITNTTGTFSGLAPGEYVATVSDGNCIAAAVISIASLGTPVITGFSTDPATSQSQVTVNWDAVPGALGYNLSYRPAGSNADWTVISGIPLNSATVRGLAPGTNYEFRIQSVCSESNVSDWSMPRTHQTSSGCNAPIRIGVERNSPVSCMHNGGEIVVVASGGTEGEYLYSINNGPFDNTTGIFRGLAAGTYVISARRGECVASTTVEVAPLAAPVITTTAVTSTSMTLSWNAIPGAVSYNLRYRLVGSSTWNELGNQTSPVTIGNLSPATNYEFSVKAVCSGGITSQWSTPTTIQTSTENSCGAPTAIRVSNITPTSATVSWQAPTTSGVCYVLSYGPATQDPSTWRSILVPFGVTTTNLTGLMPGSQYGVVMRTNCALCSASSGTRSEWSNIVNFALPAKQGTEAAEIELQVYPNPNNGVFVVEAAEFTSPRVLLHIWDVQGKLVFEQEVDHTSGSKLIVPIDLSNASPGVYLLQVQDGATKQNVRIVVN
ncbi:MAG: fibronectin type III domain-containing protein [Bacteroidia bacterium]|nr:fibronectin type III domain-containing protein [Bacteroidia bacterium]